MHQDTARAAGEAARYAQTPTGQNAWWNEMALERIHDAWARGGVQGWLFYVLAMKRMGLA